jgi:hypothetical protein
MQIVFEVAVFGMHVAEPDETVHEKQSPVVDVAVQENDNGPDAKGNPLTNHVAMKGGEQPDINAVKVAVCP